MPRAAVPLMLLLLAGCAPAAPPAAPEPITVPEAAPEAEPLYPRYAVRPVPPHQAHAAAVAERTRTARGVPGDRYWQQRVDYAIEVELVPSTARLSGRETVTYHNNSPYTLPFLVFHLHQNLFSEGVARNRAVPITGGVTMEAIRIGGRDVPRFHGTSGEVPAPAYVIDGALMVVRLTEPLPSGGSVSLDLEWSFEVPPAGAPRMGHIGHELFTVAQWFPQVATFDDVSQWHAWPYMGDGEFYLEYGDFDVSITVPEGWLVAATGTLENPGEVLPDQLRGRLARALAGDQVVHVVTESDFGPGSATRRAPGGQLTWRFSASDVRDFAFATSDRYLWDATRAVVGTTEGVPEYAAIHTFYRPVAEDWRESARFTRHAMEFHSSRWGSYIYPQMTSAEGPVGGMEYPMLTFVASFRDPGTVYVVINHEVAHQWWPMMVGSNEAANAWQDEGLATYAENLATADFRGEPSADAFAADLERYLSIAGGDEELPIMRHADLYGPGPARVSASYSKPGVLLRALEAVIGREGVERALREYTSAWMLKHPYAQDFFAQVESVAGLRLDWFWSPWFYDTVTLDQAVTEVREVDGRAHITIEDWGDAPMPAEVAVTTLSGTTVRARVPVEVWLAGAREHVVVVEVDGPVARVVVDPDLLLPDVQRGNNVWERDGS